MHGALRQALPVGGSGVKRSHLAARPSEDCFQLCDCGAGIRRAGRCNLADAIRRARNAGSATGDCELIAEARLGQRLTTRPGNERKVAAWPRR
jgi:hypothetical protein